MTASVLSLFSGAGGMDIGLAAAGFRHVGLIERGLAQRRTLTANGLGPLLGEGDINELALSVRPVDLGLSIGELDLLAGGPPCQPFSMAAQWAAGGRRGMLDDRARTVTSTLAIVRNFLPKAILFENVRGFVQGENSALGYLEKELSEISEEMGVSYRLHVRILNSADYGVPQNRRRAIVVGLRDGAVFDWPAPSHASNPLTAWDALWNVGNQDVPSSRGKWNDLLPLIPPGQNYQWLTNRGGGPEIFGYRTKFWNFLLKLSPTLPAWTLSASPGPSTGPFHWENRPLSIPEQLRLQTMPKDWVIAGNFRDQTLQVGNATPSLLAETLGRGVLSALNGNGVNSPRRLTLTRAPEDLKLPEVGFSLPERYAPLVGSKLAHAGEGRGPAARAPR